MGVSGQNWQALLDQIRQESRGGIIYVIGANDTGKSTLCTYLAENLAQRHLSAYIDCDPGQSLIGPPTTIGLKIPFHSKDTSPSIYLYFVGSTTPRGHLLQTLVGIKKLTEHAQSLGAYWIVLDSSGFVLDPVAREFQFRVIDVLQPRFLIVLQRPDNDLRWTHSYQQHPTIRLFHLEPSRAIISRNPAMRKEYRTLKFKRYFETAVSQDIPLKGISCHGRIPNLRDPSQYRALLVAC
ncbi:MAG: polynucleotide 5'-hydroxyl-kinase [candidate division KSB1 bacterium]|nr:polynucleotide 5'-hydroxyl-kinase [candidate division KSB1 bacterium]